MPQDRVYCVRCGNRRGERDTACYKCGSVFFATLDEALETLIRELPFWKQPVGRKVKS
jgi:hypothetical protein